MLSNKYNFNESERKWQDYWKNEKIYSFDKTNNNTYSIDTPPPTVSGNLHIGHIYGFVQADAIARYKRMCGYNLFFPIGFDNNGLATELFAEKQTGIKAYTKSRKEFRDICLDVVKKYNNNYKETLLQAGISVDLDLEYNTINDLAQATSQKSFIELVEKNKAYRSDKPSAWCCRCRTSVANAELEDKDIASTFNYLNFKVVDSDEVLPIATTRPELLPACVAVFVNPKDNRYKKFVGKKVIVPLFEDISVEVLTDDLVGMEKGTGAVMCCTFGDQTDVEWWKKYNLEYKKAIEDGGTMSEICGKYAGLKINDARKMIIEDLKSANYLYKQDEIIHAVKVHERCDQPVELLCKKQWFIKSCSEDDKKIWLEAGDKINWYPANAKNRYISWVENLNQDWSISRQRYFGIPFPVWYCKNCGKVILAKLSQLPVNPLESAPLEKCECGCTEFIPEIDIMDTWATSSLTPQINLHWAENEEYCNKNMPMGMRFAGRDIVNTWCLRTIIKAHYHQNNIPWKNLMINGWVMADKGVKISKHLNNSKMDLQTMINTYSSDVVRYWSINGAFGRDVLFSDEELKNGSKLLNKIYNVSKFVLMFIDNYSPKKPNEILSVDRYYMNKFNVMFDKACKFYDEFEMGYAKAEIEKYFWDFCDNYIELVKNRLYKVEIYGEKAKESAMYSCYQILFSMLKMLSITMPHICEEIYHSYFIRFEKSKSITTLRLSKIDIEYDENLMHAGDDLINVLSQIRTYKSLNGLSLKDEINHIQINTPNIEYFEKMMFDLEPTGNLVSYELNKSEKLEVSINN